MTELCKNFLNSLYGKFAQNVPDTIEWYEPENKVERMICLVPSDTKIHHQYTLMHKTVVETGSRVGDKSFIAIAAHVTENARFHLWSYIEKVGLNKVLLTDTDSIKAREKDIEPIKLFINPHKLGFLKDEGTASFFKINAPKDYVWDDEVKIKGVSKNAVQQNYNTWLDTRFVKSKTLMKQGIIDYVEIKKVPKVLSRVYTKGKMGINDYFVPYCLPADFDFVY